MVLCVFTHVRCWLSVCSSINIYGPSSLLCGSSHTYWGLLLTCRVVERRVDVLCRSYAWFSERVNAVFGCSGSLMYALCPDGFLWVVLEFLRGSERPHNP